MDIVAHDYVADGLPYRGRGVAIQVSGPLTGYALIGEEGRTDDIHVDSGEAGNPLREMEEDLTKLLQEVRAQHGFYSSLVPLHELQYQLWKVCGLVTFVGHWPVTCLIAPSVLRAHSAAAGDDEDIPLIAAAAAALRIEVERSLRETPDPAYVPPAPPPERLDFEQYIRPEEYGGGGGGGCFVAGTPIATPTGSVAIENVEVGDIVWAYDTNTRQRVAGTVAQVFVIPDASNGEVMFSDGRVLGSTPEHPFFRRRTSETSSWEYPEETEEFEVVLAAELQPGDTVFMLSGDQPELREGQVVATRFGQNEPTTVFNFQVESVHTYFANGVLVHNKE